ncbi:MAG TPA: hypothetical protein VFZ00_25390 [Solirubrobacter sp.]|nr:hypothetical protein [Solirubrobacter sp.]
MATETASSGRLGATARRDRWWLSPALTAVGLIAFGVYAFVVAAIGTDYRYTGGGADYLSPFYSPDLKGWGLDPPFSSAFLVLWVPLGFRATCYYYRKAYYRAFFLSPPACAVAGPHRRRYRGEAALPFSLMNAHRYFLALATIVLGFLCYDAGRAFFFERPGGGLEFGIGLGTIVLVINAVLLALFTFGCNSLRHLAGGRLDCFSCSAAARTRHGLWRRVSVLNRRHMEWAWLSLGWVALTDLYIRLAAAGALDDPRII